MQIVHSIICLCQVGKTIRVECWTGFEQLLKKNLLLNHKAKEIQTFAINKNSQVKSAALMWHTFIHPSLLLYSSYYQRSFLTGCSSAPFCTATCRPATCFHSVSVQPRCTPCPPPSTAIGAGLGATKYCLLTFCYSPATFL